MAGPRLLPPGLPVLLLLLALPVLPLPAGTAAPSRCPPDKFQCTPGDPCFPLGWRCDGHPDCDDGEDEWNCGTATAAEPSPGGSAVTLPRSSAVPPTASAAAPSRCPPDKFQCTPGDPCFPLGWRCDGHPDCDDGEDEWNCGTATAAEPSPGGSGCERLGLGLMSAPVQLAEPSATPEASVPSRSQGYTWILIVAGLLIILVVASSVAVWGLSKAKRRSDTSSLEKASREQLMPGKGQKSFLP